MAGLLAQGTLQKTAVIASQRLTQVDACRHGMGVGPAGAQIMLRDECRQHLFGRRPGAGLWIIGLVAESEAGADEARLDTHGGGRYRDREHVGVAAFDIHVLALLGTLEGRHPVAVKRRGLVIAPRRRLFHLPHHVVDDVAGTAFEKQNGVMHVLAVVLATDEADTGRRAALDLVLQARARAVAEEAVLALAHRKYLLHEAQALAYRRRRGIRAEVPALLALGAAVEADARKFLPIRNEDIGVTFVVAQQHVIARLLRLDEVVFEQQRLGFRVRHRDLHGRRLAHHGQDALGQAAPAEIARHPFFQVTRLADVQQPPVRIEHAVHAGGRRQAGKQRFGVQRHFASSRLASRTTASNMAGVRRRVWVL